MALNSSDCNTFAATLRGWKRPLILTHARADGDAIGCLVAMKSICAALGARPTAVTFEPISSRYHFLSNPAGLERWDVVGAETERSQRKFDGVMVLDTCTYNQLEPAATWLRTAGLPIGVIDHHLTRDLDSTWMLIDVSAAAACQLIWEWAKEVGITVPQVAAEAIFVGLATDTGWFHHSNTDARAMSVAVELMQYGVRASEMYDKLFMQESARRLRLQGAMLGTLELHLINKTAKLGEPSEDAPVIASMMIDQDMMKACQTVPGDTEDLVNEPMRIGQVAASILLYEQSDGIIRVGLRSKSVGADSPLPDIDVSKVAAQFGGGGHRHASGVRIAGRLEDVRNQVIAAILKCAKSASP